VVEVRVGEPEGTENALFAEGVERPATHLLHRGTQRDEVEIAVDGGYADLVHQARAQHSIDDPGATLGRPQQALAGLVLLLDEELVKAAPRLETRRVGEQMPKGHLLLVALGKRGQDLGHGIVEPEGPIGDQQHDGRGGGNGLGERGQIEHGLPRHGEHHGTRNLGPVDGLVQGSLHAHELSLDETPFHDSKLEFLKPAFPAGSLGRRCGCHAHSIPRVTRSVNGYETATGTTRAVSAWRR